MPGYCRALPIGLMLIVAVPALPQVQPPAPCRDIARAREGPIENSPFVLQKLEGAVKNVSRVGVTGACVAVLNDKEELVTVVQADEDGWFSLPSIGPGDYRLIVWAESLCPANARIRIVKRKIIKKSIHAHMTTKGSVECSFIALK